ncbi:hypothetical protein MC885_000686 [Smutsia gigantea]|nr:hypothetical protein MC885_000686 [Smutsia gigantea]
MKQFEFPKGRASGPQTSQSLRLQGCHPGSASRFSTSQPPPEAGKLEVAACSHHAPPGQGWNQVRLHGQNQMHVVKETR